MARRLDRADRRRPTSAMSRMQSPVRSPAEDCCRDPARGRTRFCDARRRIAGFRDPGGEQKSCHPRRDAWFSSIREELGGLDLAPARTMRATAAECLLPVTSQAIRKHLRDRGVGAGVAPEFRPKQNSALVGHNGWMVDDAPCPEIGEWEVPAVAPVEPLPSRSRRYAGERLVRLPRSGSSSARR